MTPENFAYWLQGFFEITSATTLTTPQVEMIKQHLGYVFQGKPALIKQSNPIEKRSHELDRMLMQQRPSKPPIPPIEVTC